MSAKTIFILSICHLFGIFYMPDISVYAQNSDATGRVGNPADHLPSYIHQITWFGERPDWSLDGKRILFLEKTFGDVFEYEIESGNISPVTIHFKNYGFTRALYLANGDILLAGPMKPFDITNDQERNDARNHCTLMVLNKNLNRSPVSIGTLVSEGPAVSRRTMKIAFTHTWRQYPEKLKEGESQIYVADILYDEDDVPYLSKQELVLDSRNMPFKMHSLETQNFIPPDENKLTFTVYLKNNSNNTETFVLDLNKFQYQNVSNQPDWYNEVEGVFPNGRFTCVEAAPSSGNAWPLIDLYKLALDGSGDLQRLTYFTDYNGYKASQGVISDDGLWMCFQIGKSNDEAGAGYGMFLYDMKMAPVH